MYFDSTKCSNRRGEKRYSKIANKYVYKNGKLSPSLLPPKPVKTVKIYGHINVMSGNCNVLVLEMCAKFICLNQMKLSANELPHCIEFTTKNESTRSKLLIFRCDLFCISFASISHQPISSLVKMKKTKL